MMDLGLPTCQVKPLSPNKATKVIVKRQERSLNKMAILGK
jgi:hypothetical protein